MDLIIKCEKMQMKIERYTKQRTPDVLTFEQNLHKKKDIWNWDLNEAYNENIVNSFDDPAFERSISILLRMWMEK